MSLGSPVESLLSYNVPIFSANPFFVFLEVKNSYF